MASRTPRRHPEANFADVIHDPRSAAIFSSYRSKLLLLLLLRLRLGNLSGFSKYFRMSAQQTEPSSPWRDPLPCRDQSRPLSAIVRHRNIDHLGAKRHVYW